MARNSTGTISPLMTGVADIPITDGAAGLCAFSLDFYARPKVAAALIELQDGAGLDVNLMLFALWHGWSGRGPLDCDGLASADRAVQAIRVEIIEPLRALRRRLKTAPDADIQRLRTAIKALELDAEQMAQRRLADCAGPPIAAADPAERHATAAANLALYLGSERAGSAAATIIRDAIAELAQ